ncbi:MAG: pepsin/retropepsin-like aspartic protease family protein [Planctomycetota bacterium]|nr:pepsin/retropepsin-like aspartic protease family protein [Planctomycetota bacterium]
MMRISIRASRAGFSGCTLVVAALVGGAGSSASIAHAQNQPLDGAPSTRAATTPATTPGPTLEALLAKARAGAGRDQLRRAFPHGYELTGTAQFLGEAGEASLVVGATEHASRCVLGVRGKITFIRGVDEYGPWLHDLGGEIRRLHLGEAEEARLLATALTGSWIDDPDSAGLVLSARGPGEIDYRAADGLTTGVITLDEATGRALHWTMRVGDEESRVSFVGVLEQGAGAALPASVTISRSGGEALTYTWTRATALESSASDKFHPPGMLPDGAIARPSDVAFSGHGPLESSRAKTGHALVKVGVDGHDGWFIFDTGAGGTVIDSAFADRAGLGSFGQVSARGVGGSVLASFARASELRVGPATLRQALMTRLDLQPIAKAIGHELQGVLGYNVMHRTIARVSTRDGLVTLHDPAAFDDAGLRWHTLIVYERHACVEGSFGVRPEQRFRGVFKLDTGAAMNPVAIHQPTVQRLKLLDGLAASESTAGGVGGNVKVMKADLAWLEVGGLRQENVSANFALEAKGAFADEYTLGNLSKKQIGARDIVLDYAGGRIAFPEHEPVAAPAPSAGP